jgi:hypothetical protein
MVSNRTRSYSSVVLNMFYLVQLIPIVVLVSTLDLEHVVLAADAHGFVIDCLVIPAAGWYVSL